MAKKTHGRFRSARKPPKPAPPVKRHANNRHPFQQSAVLERCICGELKDDPIHIRTRKLDPPQGPVLVQVGITPDTSESRMRVHDMLHWTFVEQIDDGVWNVDTLRPWPTNVDFSAEFTLEDGTEISISLEWP